MKKAYLILENGAVFEGEQFGKASEAFGQLVFTTAMTGYMELLSDSANSGKIVVSAFPLIGNAGVIEEDTLSGKTYLNGYIVREFCDQPSNFRSEGAIDFFLSKREIPALCKIDTRALVRILREQGAMNAKISFSPNADEATLKEIREYADSDAIEYATHKNTLVLSGEREKQIAVLDFGVGSDMLDLLQDFGVGVTRLYAYTKAEAMLGKYDGVILSTGGGDPTAYPEIAENIRKLADGNMPLFGIGFGFELLAHALGAEIAPLKYGHRGASQPVRRLDNGIILIASQNHAYCIKTLPQGAKASFMNVNDDTIEGARFAEHISGVEFVPNASDCPQDTAFVVKDFLSDLK